MSFDEGFDDNLQYCVYILFFFTVEGLVLPAHSLQLLQTLFVSRLDLEELGGVLSALLLDPLHLGHQLLALLLPVAQLLLQNPLLLVQRLTAAAGLRQVGRCDCTETLRCTKQLFFLTFFYLL